MRSLTPNEVVRKNGSPISDAVLSSIRTCAFLWLYLSVVMLVVGLIDAAIDGRSAGAFFVSAAMLSFVAGAVIMALYRHSAEFSARTGFLVVVLAWTSVSFAASIPLRMALPGLSLVDAVFESVSGFTTTGSTVLVKLDYMPAGVLLWRSMLQWIGGLGVIAMGLILLPFLRVGGVRFFRLESSDLSVEGSRRVANFTVGLLATYLIMSVACTLAYASLGMPLFDAVNHAMTTVSTGGYSTHDDSMGVYATPGMLWASTFFMFAASLPFSLFIALAAMRGAGWPRDAQAPAFLGLTLVAVGLVALTRASETGAWSWSALAEDAFNVVSVLSTTGFASAEYQNWGPGVVSLFLIITFFGGCAGSTSGGVKTFRLLVMVEIVRAHVDKLIYPNGQFPARYEGRILSPTVYTSTVVFIIAFFVAQAALTVGLGLCDIDFVTSFTGALTALTNVGPGLGGIIGPKGSFATLPDAAKILLSIGMLLGRLELIAVLVVLSPRFWTR